MKQPRRRMLGSFKEELLAKSREAMLSAVQIFNNPNIKFKSENFIILANISWMYLLHAYYREKKIDYKYYKQNGQRKKYDRTKKGAYKYWELERCLDDKMCPIDKISKANLKFLIGLRHEIEHQMTTRIDEYLSARFQACCLNYNQAIKELFGNKYGIDRHLSFSLQFSTISEDHANQLKKFTDLPANIASYINDYDDSLSEEDYNNIRYSYRVLYVQKSASNKGQADKVIEFLPPNSPESETLNKEYILIKEREKLKHLPTEIWQKMQGLGYKNFGQHQHTQLWKSKDAKNPAFGFGTTVVNSWYWYDKWAERGRKALQGKWTVI